MRIPYLLFILIVGFVRGREEGAASVPCLPKCPLSEEGRRLCESLSTSKPCFDLRNYQTEDGTKVCSCEWSAVLSHPGYNLVLDNSGCLLYSLSTCESKTRHARDTTAKENSSAVFLREIQIEISRIEQITDELQKRDAKMKLLNTLRYILDLFQQVHEGNTGKPDSSDGPVQGITTMDWNWNLDNILEGKWRTPPPTTKKPPLKMYPLKNNIGFHIAIFTVVTLIVLVVIIVCVVAKIKTDRKGVNLDLVGDLDDRKQFRPAWSTLIKKLSIRCREKAEHNAKRDKSTGSVTSHLKMAKPPMSVPSKSSLGRTNSNTDVKSVAGKRTDSCTMISGLTHGNTSGSDVEIDNEFRMFRTTFKEDFKSLLNVNQDKHERP